jgi:hypothetical protein
MPVADDDYRKKKSKANLQGRGNQYDPMDIIGLGGGGAAGSVAARAAAPVAKSVLSSAAKFVRGFFGSGASNATRGVVVNTARTGTTVARVPKRIGPGSGSSNLPAVRKAKGKKGKGVSNYGYTMYKDYLTSSRAGAKADTIRVTGSKPKEGA